MWSQGSGFEKPSEISGKVLSRCTFSERWWSLGAKGKLWGFWNDSTAIIRSLTCILLASHWFLTVQCSCTSIAAHSMIAILHARGGHHSSRALVRTLAVLTVELGARTQRIVLFWKNVSRRKRIMQRKVTKRRTLRSLHLEMWPIPRVQATVQDRGSTLDMIPCLLMMKSKLWLANTMVSNKIREWL